MKKIPVWKNATLMAALLVAIVIVTFAWFYTGPYADLGVLSTDVGKGSFIQISGDQGNNWSGDLDVEFGINKNFKEISGDGNLLFAPVYDAVDGENGFVTQLVSFETATEGYYEQTFDFRADVVQTIYLKPESFVTAVGNGYIDGAVRVAFFEVDKNGNEELKLIWAPNSAVQYSSRTNSYTRNGSVEPYYYYQKSSTLVDISTLEETNSHVAMIPTDGTDDQGCGYNEEYNFMWSNGNFLPDNAPSVLSVDALGENNYYYKQLKVRVWIEGYDRECVKLLSGQKFTMELQFTAQEVE